MKNLTSTCPVCQKKINNGVCIAYIKNKGHTFHDASYLYTKYIYLRVNDKSFKWQLQTQTFYCNGKLQDFYVEPDFSNTNLLNQLQTYLNFS